MTGTATWVREYAPMRGTSSNLDQKAGKVMEVTKHTGNIDAQGLVYSSIVNLTKSIVGAGVLCLPYTLQEGGFGLGMFLLSVTGALSLTGFLAIGHVCHITGAKNYREAWKRTVGVYPEFVDLCLLLECFICCVGFMIVTLDYLSIGMHGLVGLTPSTSNRTKFAALIAVSCLMPLCLRQRIHSLRFSSMLGNAALFYTIGYVIWECLAWEGHWDFLDDLHFVSPKPEGWFRAASVMTSAYIAHYNAPTFMAELAEHPTPWTAYCIATVVSFAVAAVGYATFSAAGFARFSPTALGNILLNYESNIYILVAWLSMAAALIVSYPLQMNIIRDIVARVLQLQPPSSDGDSPRGAKPSPWSAMTVTAVATTVMLGTYFTDISRVLALRGALLGCPLSFVLPGIMLLYTPAGTGPEGQSRRPVLKQTAAGMLIVFGATVGITGLVWSLRSS